MIKWMQVFLEKIASLKKKNCFSSRNLQPQQRTLTPIHQGKKTRTKHELGDFPQNSFSMVFISMDFDEVTISTFCENGVYTNVP